MKMKYCCVCMLLVFGYASAASAQSKKAPSNPSYEEPSPHLGLRIEPGIAAPLSSPQSDRFELGAGQTVKAFLGLTPWLDIGPSIAFTDLPASDQTSRSGTAWDLGAGARVKKALGASGVMPWADAGVSFVRTGEASRVGFDAGLGLSFAFGKMRAVRLGPFARYRHIVQPEQAGFDASDAKLLHAGISIEFGSPRTPVAAPAKTETTSSSKASASSEKPKKCEPCAEPEPAEKLTDGDGDGFPDKYDRCAEVAGEDWGCPSYEDVAIEPSRIELKDKVMFDWNKADIREDSHAVLDQTAKLLKKHTGFKVRVDGHADATGLDGYNQKLSERRAQAVVDYLVDQGVDQERFVIKGYSSSKPADTNLTDAGRQKNRRVEFVIDFEILD